MESNIYGHNTGLNCSKNTWNLDLQVKQDDNPNYGRAVSAQVGMESHERTL